MTERGAELTAVARAQVALAEDHRRLHELVDRLRAVPAAPDLLPALATLVEALGHHFQLEEKPGGLYDSLGACVPAHRDRLSRLVDDHYRLLAESRQLLARVRGVLDTPFEALRQQTESLAGLLAEHERREDDLVRAVLGRDVVA